MSTNSRKIAVIDSETDPFKKGRIPVPFLWGFYDGDEYIERENIADLLSILIDENYIVYAHNGGKFDYHFMLDFIDLDSPVKIINGRIAKFKIGKCEFRDSMNILPMPLSAYQKTKIDYSLFEKSERNKPENKKLISAYLKDDCVFLHELVTGFVDRFGPSLTVAGAALKQWGEISGETPPNDYDGYLYNKFNKFYYGGRCESFEYGVVEDEFSLVDINSAYPYAMLHEHPYGHGFGEINELEFDKLSEEEKSRAFITFTADSLGAFPYRSKDSSLFFPDDNENREFNTTGWELLAAVEMGALKNYNFISATIFYESIDFKKYITKFYTERKAAKTVKDKATDLFCKLMMNSLYGKFGANPDNYSNFIVGSQHYLDNDGRYIDEKEKNWSYSGEFGSRILLTSELDERERRFYHIATAASITGFVRAYLFRALKTCEGVLYCDTDSIAARKIKFLPNGLGKELGQWEVEGEFKRGAFCGKKLYAMEHKKPAEGKTHKIACKGVKLVASDLFKMAKGEIIYFENEVPVFSVHKAPHFLNKNVKMNKRKLIEEQNVL